MKKKRDIVQYGAGFVGFAFLGSIRQKNPEARIAGVDISPRAIAALKQEGVDAFYPADFKAYGDALIHSFSIATPAPRRQNGHSLRYGFDLTFLEKALVHFASHVLAKASEHKVVVIRSTLTPTTTEKRLIPLLERHSGKRAGRDFSVIYNPEFLRQDFARTDALDPPLIAFSSTDELGSSIFEGFFRIFGAPFVRLPKIVQAESLKIFNNSFNAVVISFFNECLLEFAELGCNEEEARVVFDVLTRTALAKRDPGYGTRLLGPYGGTCLPKDTRALLRVSERVFHRESLIVRAARQVNRQMKKLWADGHLSIPQVRRQIFRA